MKFNFLPIKKKILIFVVLVVTLAVVAVFLMSRFFDLNQLVIDLSIQENLIPQDEEVIETDKEPEIEIVEKVIKPSHLPVVEGMEEEVIDNEEVVLVDSQIVLLDVPFTPQAPFGNWDDKRQSYGCEEASLLMAMRWASGQSLTFQEAEQEIIAMAEFEKENYGVFYDSSTADTFKLLKDYFKYEKVSLSYDIGVEDIKVELAKGNVIVVPIDGTKVGNSYYTPPGPLNHMMIVIGYDDTTQEFITNDPGTKRGEGFRYDYNIFENAIADYLTGFDLPREQIRTAMLVIEK